MRNRLLVAPVMAMIVALPVQAQKTCNLQKYAELPVTMAGSGPLIAGTINGSPAWFLADSGGLFNAMSLDSAAKYGLKIGVSPLTVRGIGGRASTALVKVNEFTLAGFYNGSTIRNVEFLVAGSFAVDEADGIIGQNVIGNADAEYDLAHGVIRLFKSKDCYGQSLAYWNSTGDVAELAIGPTTPIAPHVIGQARINGKRIRVLFDTGTWRSVMTTDAAARTGIKPESNDVAAADIIGGVGRDTVETWVARFDTFEVGGETIRNARLRIGDFDAGPVDMLLGADFFLAHRVFVARSQRKVYFTYNGGTVFDLRENRTDANDSVPASAQTPAPVEPGPPVPSATASDAPTDAAGFRRRGAAYAARQNIQSALADFDQAIRLDAADPENYYQRGLARLQNRQSLLATSDFDEALKIKPDHTAALLSRGALRLYGPDEAGGRADLDTVARLSPNDSSVLLKIADVFDKAGKYAESIERLNTWIATNPKDDRLPMALNNRCWTRAEANLDLDLALADCNAALKSGPRDSAVYDSRGLVFLRRGDFERSIADYKASLKLQPKAAHTLYGLGLAEVRKGLRADGERDIQAAIALNPMAAERYSKIGLAP